VDRLAVAVTNAVPYRVSIVPPTTGLTADGTLEVRVRIERDKDFTGDLDVTLPLLPHGVEGPIKQTVSGTATETVFPLVASGEMRPGTWPLVAEVRAAKTVVRGDRGTGGTGGTGGGRRSRRDGPTAAVASPVVMLPLVAAPITGKIAPVAGELGKAVRVVCRLEGTLPGAMQATLDGLPPRAKASPVSVKPGDGSVTFDVMLDPTTPAGKHPTLSVVLAGSREGSKLSYRVGHGGVLLAAEPGKLAIGKDGKPLSPLEALRAAEKTPSDKALGENP
jgi:hypothetical protein